MAFAIGRQLGLGQAAPKTDIPNPEEKSESYAK
jgi:hypothetical protein